MNDAFRQLIGPDEGADARQLCVRAVLLMVVGIVYIRVAGRRTFAHASPLDIIVYLIVGSNLSRVMTGKAAFWPVMDATLLFVALHRLLATATLRWQWLGAVLKGSPVVLVRDGQADAKAMLRHGVSHGDLEEALRQEKVAHPTEARLAVLERSGKISVVKAK